LNNPANAAGPVPPSPRTACRPVGSPGLGVERIDVHMATEGHARHRHDSYAVGLTLAGVQAFDYRGEAHRTLAGEAYVLHPDERHDGRPGTDGGFAYRTLYIPPALIGACLPPGPLPFVSNPVCGERLRRVIVEVLAATDEDTDEVEWGDTLTLLSDHLADAAGHRPPRHPGFDRPAMARVAEALRAALQTGLSATDLEHLSGLDRWTLYRQFRAVHGVSPRRYLTARRLDAARAAISAGATLADAALGAGFADQSHMSRQFRAVLGLTPGQWRTLTRPSPQDRPGVLGNGA